MKIQKSQVAENRTLIKITAENKKELIQEFWRYINYGNSVCLRKGSDITDDFGLTYINVLENEAYFTADTNEFIKTLQAIELFKLSEYTQNEQQISDKMRKRAEINGLKIWNEIEETNIKDAGEIEIMLTEA